MKNVFLAVVFGLAIVLVVMLAVQARQLSRLRGDIAELRSERDGMKSRIAEYEGTIAELEGGGDAGDGGISSLRRLNASLLRQNKELKTQLAEKESLIDEMKERYSAADEGVLTADADAEAGEKDSASAMKNYGEYIEELMKNPEMAEMIRQNQRTTLDMMYGDLFKDLRLSEEELESFKDLLVDKQMIILELGMPMMSGDLGEDEKKAMTEKIEEKQAEIDEEIKMLLGEAGYEEFENYSKNLGDRMLLGQYKRGLEGTGIEPLDERQEEELLAAMSEERENFEFSADFGDPNNLDYSRFTEENINTFLKERKKLAERVLDRSRTILTEEQFEKYKESVESQLKLEKIQMEMAVKMFGSKGSVGKTTEESEAEDGDGEDTGDEESGNDTAAEDEDEDTTGGE
jgi:hypothetical protein